MAVGTLTEEIAANLEEAAEVTRCLDTRALGFLGVGLAVGAVVGFYYGNKFKKEKIRAELFAQSQREIEEIREVYAARTVASQPKPSVEEVIEEKGYSVRAEEEETVELDPDVIDEAVEKDIRQRLSQRPLRPPVPVDPAKRVFRTADATKDKNDGWSYAYELANRSPDRPFNIHQDEFALNESAYDQVTYVYYDGDDVLADEHGEKVENTDDLVGDRNLTRFGHGSDDMNIVHIRNSVLELEMEVCRTPQSFEEEVLGLENDSESD